MKVPRKLLRIVTPQCRKVSLTPSHTPPNLPTLVSAILVPLTARSMISGMANSPIPTGTRLSPFIRYGMSKPNLMAPVLGSIPMVAINKPVQPAIKPRVRDSPLRAAIKLMPSSASIKNSGEPRDSTSGVTMGIEAARTKAPTTAPIRELNRAAPRARPASPFLAMG